MVEAVGLLGLSDTERTNETRGSDEYQCWHPLVLLYNKI